MMNNCTSWVKKRNCW